MGKIISIGTATPAYKTKQENILEFMHTAYANPTSSRKLNMLYRHCSINQRYSAIPDFNKELNTHTLFNEQAAQPEIDSRLDVFKDKALPLALLSINSAFSNINIKSKEFAITHVISVTCTGLMAPGLDTQLIEALDLPEDTFRTAVNFQGCNAAFHALKLGDLITKSEPNARVLITCVELCTLHFKPKNNHDNLLSNTIFGDGAASVLMVPESDKQHTGLSTMGFHSLLLNKGKELMGWNITPLNFEMVLSAKIPEFIGDEVLQIVETASKKLGFNIKEINTFAVHPGGKKILDKVKQALNLSEENLKHSYKVLNDYGNMSSPTILFILKELMDSPHKHGDNIYAIGFGPGLSIESTFLKYV